MTLTREEIKEQEEITQSPDFWNDSKKAEQILMMLPEIVLIFPYLSAGNIAYKLMQEMGHYEVIGPVINGMHKSSHVLNIGSTVSEIVNMVSIAVIDSHCVEKRNGKQ